MYLFSIRNNFLWNMRMSLRTISRCPGIICTWSIVIRFPGNIALYFILCLELLIKCKQNHNTTKTQAGFMSFIIFMVCRWLRNTIAVRRRFKNAYALVNMTALKPSFLKTLHTIQCMGKIFWVTFQRVPWNSTQNILPIHPNGTFEISHKIFFPCNERYNFYTMLNI